MNNDKSIRIKTTIATERQKKYANINSTKIMRTWNFYSRLFVN